MKRNARLLLLVLLLISLASCAHVISRDLRDQADPFLTVHQALNNPTEYKGKIVIWGGEILRTENRQDGSTEIEVLQRALDRWEEPKDPSASEGRFLVREQRFLDPSIFRPGMRITVGGELQGVEAVPLGQMEYWYPLVLARQLYLWPPFDYPYYYSYYPYYSYYYPYAYSFFLGGFYGGGGFYRHHHGHRGGGGWGGRGGRHR
jgi:outer membrane lipoprotein